MLINKGWKVKNLQVHSVDIEPALPIHRYLEIVPVEITCMTSHACRRENNISKELILIICGSQQLLKDDGCMLLQAITMKEQRLDYYRSNVDFTSLNIESCASSTQQKIVNNKDNK